MQASSGASEYRVCLENISFQLLITGLQNVQNPKRRPTSSLHNHISTELFFCAEGEIVLHTADREICLQTGDIALIPPGIAHENCGIKEPSRGIVLSFLCEKIKNEHCTDLYKMLSPLITEQNILIYRNQLPLVNKTIDSLAECCQNPPLFTAALALRQILCLLSLKSEAVLADRAESQKSPLHRDIHFMMKLDHLIFSGYSQKIDIRKAAQTLYISPRQLDRIVKKRYGKTFHAMCMEQRIHSAEQHLLSTAMSVDQIAIAVGFNSSVGLYREFEKKHRMTPTQFRKQYK